MVWVVLSLTIDHDVLKHTGKTLCRQDTLALVDYYISELCSYSTNLSREIHLDHKNRKLNMIMAAL